MVALNAAEKEGRDAGLSQERRGGGDFAEPMPTQRARARADIASAGLPVRTFDVVAV